MAALLVLAYPAYLLYEYAHRDRVRTSTVVVCRKGESGGELTMTTSSGTFRFVDSGPSTARTSYDEVRVGWMYEVAYQGGRTPGATPLEVRALTPRSAVSGAELRHACAGVQAPS
ncbi:hypothetical protein [Streptomyces sp. TRM49041]|uniref:hypothetical protein n=1 Tax=Streptomyces sp. TRM49041 TaxID=2603216 RepID=UPI0011EBAEB8|nr:hypothetical protein [Streptomyces sp. TRM49041]